VSQGKLLVIKAAHAERRNDGFTIFTVLVATQRPAILVLKAAVAPILAGGGVVEYGVVHSLALASPATQLLPVFSSPSTMSLVTVVCADGTTACLMYLSPLGSSSAACSPEDRVARRRQRSFAENVETQKEKIQHCVDLLRKSKQAVVMSSEALKRKTEETVTYVQRCEELENRCRVVTAECDAAREESEQLRRQLQQSAERERQLSKHIEQQRQEAAASASSAAEAQNELQLVRGEKEELLKANAEAKVDLQHAVAKLSVVKRDYERLTKVVAEQQAAAAARSSQSEYISKLLRDLDDEKIAWIQKQNQHEKTIAEQGTVIKRLNEAHSATVEEARRLRLQVQDLTEQLQEVISKDNSVHAARRQVAIEAADAALSRFSQPAAPHQVLSPLQRHAKPMSPPTSLYRPEAALTPSSALTSAAIGENAFCIASSSQLAERYANLVPAVRSTGAISSPYGKPHLGTADEASPKSTQPTDLRALETVPTEASARRQLGNDGSLHRSVYLSVQNAKSQS
jgi:hypothetical protein